MVKLNANPPLTISKEAHQVIESTRLNAHKKKSDFLRVKATVRPDTPTVSFDMFFDDVLMKGDMAYKTEGTKLLLDNDTAYLLVGSKLVQLDSGELKFVHLDTTACFDMTDTPIMN